MKLFKVTVRDCMIGDLTGEFFALTKKEAIAQALDFYAHECDTDKDSLKIVKVESEKIKDTNSPSFRTKEFGNAIIETATYSDNGALAVELIDENGELMATLSTNLPEFAHQIGKDEFFVKNYSENESIARDALASGLFRETGRASDGPMRLPIWTLNFN